MITTYLNWTCCFIFLIPFIIVTLIFLLSLPKEEVDKDSEIDYLGAVTQLFSVIFCVYGITHFSSIYGWISLGIGVIVLSVFINHELKTSNALYDFRLLKNKNYAIDNYVALVISLTAFALPYFYGLYFQYYRLCTPSQAGLLVLMYGLFYILSNLIITKVYNHVEIKRLYKVSMSIQPLIVLILIFSNNLQLELIIGLICLSTFLNGFADVLNRSFVLGVYGEEKISDTSSFLSTARNYGDLIIT